MDSLQIDPTNELIHQPRFPCSKCSSTFTLYCPLCLLPIQHDPPQVKLPKKVVIYRHPSETLGKSTSIHGPILSRDGIHLIITDLQHEGESLDKGEIQDGGYLDPKTTLLLFPSKESKPVHEIDPDSFDQIIVLDGTWKQANAMSKRIKNHYTRHVCIQNHQTLFWRYQPYDLYHLATIESIYYLFTEYEIARNQEYNGQYDNLLFYFKIQWEKIQNFYKQQPQRTFTRKKLDASSYIKYED